MERDVRNVATIDRALHRRQFVLDREPHKIHDDWVVVPLANRFTLSHCPELEVTCALDADGRQWIVLGNAFDLDNEYRRAELSISRLPSQNIPFSTYSWSGRWALIGPSAIIPDASGCLGLFRYRSTTGRLLVSSSLSILTQLIRESGLDPAIGVTPRVVTWGIDWVPPPCTNADPIRKLLPDQTLSLSDGQTIHLARLIPRSTRLSRRWSGRVCCPTTDRISEVACCRTKADCNCTDRRIGFSMRPRLRSWSGAEIRDGHGRSLPYHYCR